MSDLSSGKNVKTVSSSAGWTLSEGVPILIVGAIGALSLWGLISGSVATPLAILGMIFGFGLTGFLTWVNMGRKRKSTLFAELDASNGYHLTVWMRKPRKDKWGKSINRDVNTSRLVNTRFIVLDDVMATRVVKFNYGKGKELVVPVRLIKDSVDVRHFLVEFFTEQGDKVKFNKKTDRDEFLTILNASTTSRAKTVTSSDNKDSGTGKASGVVVDEDLGEVDETLGADAVTASEDRIVPEGAEPAGVASGGNTAPLVATQVIGYEKYAKKTVEDSVNDAVVSLTETLDNDDRDKQETIVGLDSLGLFGKGDKSVVINLPADADTEGDKGTHK